MSVMRVTTGRILSLLAGGLCLLSLSGFALVPKSTPTDERAFLPPKQVTQPVGSEPVTTGSFSLPRTQGKLPLGAL